MWDFKLGFTPNFWLHPLLNSLQGSRHYYLWIWEFHRCGKVFICWWFFFCKASVYLSKWDFFSKFQMWSEDVMKLVVSFKRDFSSLRSVEITTTIFCLSELSWEPWLDKKSEIDIGFLSNWTSVQQSSWGCNMSIRFICCCCTRAHSRQIIID